MYVIWICCNLWNELINSTSGWSPVWCVMVIMISAGVMVSRSASVVASVMWSGMTFVWIIATVTLIWVGVWLWSWPAMSVPVPVVVSRSQSGAMPCVRVLSLMECRCAWWWYPIWAVHYYMTIFITFKAMYMQAMTCDVVTLGTGSFDLPHWTLH